MGDLISHSGKVLEITSSGKVNVMILNKSACASCSSKSMCSVFEMKEKIISVNKPEFDVNPGDEVNVVMEESIGYIAVFMSYILPFILIISVLIVSYVFTLNDIVTGISILLLLTAYFFIIYMFRNSFEKKAVFRIKRI